MQLLPDRPALTGRAGPSVRSEALIFAVGVERILTAHPAVRDAAVIGVPDTVLGGGVAGFVQLERGVRPHIIDELLTSVTVLLAGYKVPISLEVVQAIPRDHLGTIDHNSLLTMTSADGGNEK
jgi:acyl-coenzyme A synthetase/AMP-(fatty) acid ligase